MTNMLILILSSWLLTSARCDVTTAGEKLRDVFQQVKNQGLHIPQIEVCVAFIFFELVCVVLECLFVCVFYKYFGFFEITSTL